MNKRNLELITCEASLVTVFFNLSFSALQTSSSCTKQGSNDLATCDGNNLVSLVCGELATSSSCNIASQAWTHLVSNIPSKVGLQAGEPAC